MLSITLTLFNAAVVGACFFSVFTVVGVLHALRKDANKAMMSNFFFHSVYISACWVISSLFALDRFYLTIFCTKGLIIVI